MMKMLYGMGIENYNAALENPGRLLFCHFIFHLSYFFCYKMIGEKRIKMEETKHENSESKL